MNEVGFFFYPNNCAFGHKLYGVSNSGKRQLVNEHQFQDPSTYCKLHSYDQGPLLLICQGQ